MNKSTVMSKATPDKPAWKLKSQAKLATDAAGLSSAEGTFKTFQIWPQSVPRSPGTVLISAIPFPLQNF
jgi:hypothetical protein